MPLSNTNELTVVTAETPPRGPVVPGLVTIRVLAARGLQSLELFGKPDTYVAVTYGGQTFRTQPVNDSEDPAYNEDIISTVGLEEEAFVSVAVMEKYTAQDKLLGAMQFPADAFAYNYLEPSWFELERNGEVTGEICLSACFAAVALPGGLGAGSASNGSGLGIQGSGPIEHMAQYLAGPRPWFMRGGYYYDLSKRVYRKVKALPVLSLTASVSESVVEGVLSRTVMRHPAGAAGAVAESSVARLDHVVTGLITQIDSGIDTAKDSVLRKAVDIKQRIAGQQQQRAAAAALAEQQQEEEDKAKAQAAAPSGSGSKGGRVWWAIEGTVHHVARPVWGYVPIVGGLVVRTLDYVVPPPASAAAAPKAMPTARVIATPVGGDEKSSAFDPVMAK